MELDKFKYGDRELIDVDVVVLDGLERAMIGVTMVGDGDEPRAIYDIDVAIGCLCEVMGIGENEAYLLIEESFIQTSVVRGNPLFIFSSARMPSEGDNLPRLPRNLGFSH